MIYSYWMFGPLADCVIKFLRLNQDGDHNEGLHLLPAGK